MTSQFQIINKILQNKDYSLVSLNNLTEDYFFNYRAEFAFIKNHIAIYHVVPDRLTFVQQFPDFDIQDVTEPDNYLIDQLFRDYNQSYMATTFNEMKRRIESDKPDEALALYLKSVEGLKVGGAMRCVDLIQDHSRYEKFVQKTQSKGLTYISTGFRELDGKIGGIDPENEVMVIAARTGIGKSWCLVKMACAAFQQGLQVGIYSGEMTADKIGYRIDTVLGGVNNKNITRGDARSIPEYTEYIKSLGLHHPEDKLGAIKVITPADISGPVTVDALKAFVEREKLEILFIDQYSLLEDTSNSRVMHERVANISKAIKNLQVMNHIPIISVAQMNRVKNENGEQDSTQIGLSDRIAQDATTLIMLDKKDAKDEFDPYLTILTLNVVKARDGGEGKLQYKCNLNKGIFNYIPEGLDDDEAAELEESYATSTLD